MAAEQLQGRVCSCGCGGSLEGRVHGARYTLECSERLRDQREKRKTQKRAALRLAAPPREARSCACGCGVLLEGLHRMAQYTPGCLKRRKREKEKAYDASRAQRHKPPHPRGAAGWQRNSATDAPYVPTMKCHVCCDMSWCRRPDRPQEGRDGYAPSEQAVGVDTGESGWRCVGCDEPYAPEPPPERGPLLRSSAGTAAKASELWGYQPIIGGQKSPAQMVGVREAKKAKGQNDGG